MRSGVARVALAILLVSAGATACSKKKSVEDVVRAMIDATEERSFAFTYTDQPIGLPVTTVKGFVDDDFRYKVRENIGGEDVLDEVASDDALAMRVLNPDRLGLFLDKKEALAAGDRKDAPAIAAVGALQSRRWALDPQGAPSFDVLRGKVAVGIDQVFDAMTAFDYIRQAIDRSIQVKRFDSESTERIYKIREDPFPAAENGSGVVRYDLKAPPLPKSVAGGEQPVPDVTNFRKMAIYTKDGLITEVREVVDVATRIDDLRKTYGITMPKDKTTVEEQVLFATQVINTVRTGQGKAALRPRSMRIEVLELGQPHVVELPTEDVVEGNLIVMRNRGKRVFDPNAPIGSEDKQAGGDGTQTQGQIPPNG
jgi:hypothetical protein